MDITPLVAEGQQIVQSYTGGVFRISGRAYEGAVLLSPEKTTVWDVPHNIGELALENFQPVIDLASEYDVFLFGSGALMQFLPKNLKNALRAKGVSFDVMDTGAACRTYNVLMAEGRRVLVAMLPA